MSDPDRLPWDQQVVLGHWACQAAAERWGLTYEQAKEILAAAYEYNPARVQMLGTSMFAGVQVDGEWLFVESRARLQQAAQEWATLRAMERQFKE